MKRIRRVLALAAGWAYLPAFMGQVLAEPLSLKVSQPSAVAKVESKANSCDISRNFAALLARVKESAQVKSSLGRTPLA